MKRLLSVLLALVMALGLLATTAWADETHTDHCVCCGNYTGTGHTHATTTWEPWDDDDSLPTDGGNYYLTQDVTVSTTVPVPDTTGQTGWLVSGKNINITLCLNGHELKGNTGGHDFITVKKDASLTITDCSGNNAGAVKGGYHIISVAGGTFNMYGGKITGRSTAACGSVYVPSGTFNMYGGKITENKTTTRTDSLGGGGVYNEGTFNMYGGEISENKSEKFGGGVFNAGNFNMYGGTIKENTVTNNDGSGGSIYNGKNNNNSSTGNFTFTGGTVSGEVYVKENTTATILGQLGTGATIKGDNDSVEQYTVAFNTSGGSAVARQTCIGENAKAVKPADPTKEGYAFVGWVNDDGSDYSFDAVVTCNLTLTAVWEEIPAPEGHTHTRRQPAATTTTTDTTVTDTTKTDTVTSAKTFDMGVMVYGVMATASVLGMGYVSKKRG